MSGGMIEHRGVVQRIEAGQAVVAMETGGCSSCGHGGSCGIGKMASGRAATLLTVPASAGLQVGDLVSIGLQESRLSLSALLGYLFPAFAMLLGAWLGSALSGNDGGTALGAIGGFLLALVLARLLIGLLPGLLPTPQLIPLSSHSHVSQQEFHHEH